MRGKAPVHFLMGVIHRGIPCLNRRDEETLELCPASREDGSDVKRMLSEHSVCCVKNTSLTQRGRVIECNDINMGGGKPHLGCCRSDEKHKTICEYKIDVYVSE
jgi:hypothetical protein